jgi:peptidyl-prolyl cis-trans isomerase C
MSEGTPDRLKEFRAQYAATPLRRGWLPVVQIVVTLAGFAAIAVLVLHPAAQPAATAPGGTGLPAEKQREYAVYLAEKKMPLAAIEAYQQYLNAAALTPQERAKVCYTMGKLAVEAEKFEEALPHLYAAEFLDPASELKDEINKKVVLCLDKLGRNVDLRHELRKRTDIRRTPADVQPGEVVLAEFAGEIITNRDLELEIEKLSPAVRDSINTPEKKGNLLKNMVAERLLLDKARRLELDKSPEIQDQLAKQVDTMIVEKMISDEIHKDVNVTPEDVERFYKAETARFTEPASAEAHVGKADTEEAAKALTDFPDKPVTVRKGGRVPGAPASLAAPETLFTADPGAVVGPVEAEKKWYVFKVVSKTSERVPPFEEVKDRAGRVLKMQKEQEKVSALIEETLQARDVHLHLDRLKEPAATQ